MQDLSRCLEALEKAAEEKKRVRVYRRQTGIVYVPKELAGRVVDRYVLRLDGKVVVLIVADER